MNGYKESLRQYFSVQAKALRKKRKLTQEEMSEQLHITVRAYGDLERGCSCCSEYGWSQTCAIGRQQRGISLVDVEKCGKS